MLGLVNDILDFQRIEAGQLELEYIPFSVVHETDKVVATMLSGAEKNKIKVLRKQQLIHTVRMGDPLRFRQVLFNLLSNALKFTPHGGEVTVKLSDWEEDHQKIKVEVIDTGIGIPHDRIEHLFNVSRLKAHSSLVCCIMFCRILSNQLFPSLLHTELYTGRLIYWKEIWRLWAGTCHFQFALCGN